MQMVSMSTAKIQLTLIHILDSVPMPKAILEADAVPSFQGRCRIDLITRQKREKEVDYVQS